MNTYFAGCRPIEEVRARFRELAMKYHPDRGGDTATMQAVNAAYEEALRGAAREAYHAYTDARSGDRTEGRKAPEYPGWMDAILHDLAQIEAVEIELVGTWLYVRIRAGLDATAFRAALAQVKARGLWFSGKHKAWIYNGEAKGRKVRRTSLSMDDIRARYGSSVLKEAEEAKRAGAIPAR